MGEVLGVSGISWDLGVFNGFFEWEYVSLIEASVDFGYTLLIRWEMCVAEHGGGTWGIRFSDKPTMLSGKPSHSSERFISDGRITGGQRGEKMGNATVNNRCVVG